MTCSSIGNLASWERQRPEEARDACGFLRSLTLPARQVSDGRTNGGRPQNHDAERRATSGSRLESLALGRRLDALALLSGNLVAENPVGVLLGNGRCLRFCLG